MGRSTRSASGMRSSARPQPVPNKISSGRPGRSCMAATKDRGVSRGKLAKRARLAVVATTTGAAPCRAAIAAAPAPDRGVVALGQDLGHDLAAELERPRVLRVLEQAGAEALVVGGGRLAEHAGAQARDRVDQRERGRLAARQDEIAERQLL